MIESPTDVARRLRRSARADRIATRYWAGWKLQLTFGPYEEFPHPELIASAKAAATAILGPPAEDPEAQQAVNELERDLWHLSVSWRGGHPAESAKLLLAELVVVLGVPEDERAGRQIVRTFTGGRLNPQVTHWMWKDPSFRKLPDKWYLESGVKPRRRQGCSCVPDEDPCGECAKFARELEALKRPVP